MRWMLVAALLGACVEGEESTWEEALPDGELAPPGALEVAVSQVVGGMRARSTARSAPAGQEVVWAASTTSRGRTCPPRLGGACFDFGRAAILGSDTTNAARWAELQFGVPMTVPDGRTVYFQALTIDPAGQVYKSPVVARTAGFMACLAVYMPVCGLDGQTYGNSCEAEVSGMLIDHNGPC